MGVGRQKEREGWRVSQNRRAEGERATGAYEVLVGASDGLVCFSRCDFVIGRRQGSRLKKTCSANCL